LWRARVSRIDGYMIKTFPDDREYPWIETRGMERRSAEDAIEAAKKMIDEGGCSKPHWSTFLTSRLSDVFVSGHAVRPREPSDRRCCPGEGPVYGAEVRNDDQPCREDRHGRRRYTITLPWVFPPR
jgi:hypothetical protein